MIKNDAVKTRGVLGAIGQLIGAIIDTINEADVEVKPRVVIQPRPSCMNNIIMLPTKPRFMSDEQVMINLDEVRYISTKSGFDYYIIIELYSGRTFEIEYSFSSNMKKDMNIIQSRLQGSTTYGQRIKVNF